MRTFTLTTSTFKRKTPELMWRNQTATWHFKVFSFWSQGALIYHRMQIGRKKKKIQQTRVSPAKSSGGLVARMGSPGCLKPEKLKEKRECLMWLLDDWSDICIFFFFNCTGGWLDMTQEDSLAQSREPSTTVGIQLLMLTAKQGGLGSDRAGNQSRNRHSWTTPHEWKQENHTGIKNKKKLLGQSWSQSLLTSPFPNLLDMEFTGLQCCGHQEDCYWSAHFLLPNSTMIMRIRTWRLFIQLLWANCPF